MNEFDELLGKIIKLEAFFGGAIFKTLPIEEQSRLRKQIGHMKAYRDVLNERISAF